MDLIYTTNILDRIFSALMPTANACVFGVCRMHVVSRTAAKAISCEYSMCEISFVTAIERATESKSEWVIKCSSPVAFKASWKIHNKYSNCKKMPFNFIFFFSFSYIRSATASLRLPRECIREYYSERVFCNRRFHLKRSKKKQKNIVCQMYAHVLRLFSFSRFYNFTFCLRLRMQA